MAPTTSSGMLQVHDLTCRLGSNKVLERLALPDLGRGQLIALLGPNGSGKSTLLRSISGLIPATAHTLALDGTNLLPLSARLRSAFIRYLPQSPPDAIHLTVIEAMLVAVNARGAIPARRALERTQKVLSQVGIEDLGMRYLDELSGGQKQLVSLAQALVHEPAVLLLDEPLASLDLNFQHHAMQLLKQLTRTHGLLIVVVLHDLNMVLRYADAALLLLAGKLLASGEPLTVITPPLLAQAFQVHARVERCSLGHANVLVDDLIQL